MRFVLTKMDYLVPDLYGQHYILIVCDLNVNNIAKSCDLYLRGIVDRLIFFWLS
jgi:hypothetical protein